MGATNRFKLSYVAEVTKGTTPTSPAFKEMRIASSGLVATPTRVTSPEIRSDRQVTDQVLTKLDTGGSIDIALSFAAHDDFIEAVLQGAWTNKPSITVATIDTEISDVSATTLTVAAALGTPFKVGMLVFTSGFTTVANNGILSRVSSSGSTTVVFPGSTFAAEAAQIPVGAAARVVGFQGAAGDLVAVTAGGNAITSTLLDFTTLGLSPGEWVKVGGDTAGSQFATAADNSWCRISTAAATRLSFSIVPSGWTADTGAAKTIQIFTGDFAKNGTTQRAFTFEAQQQDITTPSYEYFTGEQVSDLSLDLKSAAIITGSITVTGQGTPGAVTARVAGATDTAPPTYPVLNAASNVGRLAVNGIVVGGPSYVMELGLDIKNNLSGQSAINNISPVGILNGEIDVGGKLISYFGDIVNVSAVLADTDTSVMFRAGRSDGNRESLLFDVPSAKLSGTAPVTAKNTDRMFTGTYAGKMHATLGYTVAAQRYWYLPVAA